MQFDFEDYTPEPVEIDLSAFEGADVIIALAGDRYVDYAARPGVRIRAAREDRDDPNIDDASDDVVVAYSGCGEEEDYEGYEAAHGFRVVVTDFAALLPEEMGGASGVMDALDAVAGEVLAS